MNRRFFYFFLLLLGMAVTFVGCEADIEEDPENTVFCSGVVEAEGLDVSGFSVSSLIESSTVLDNRFSVKATSNGKLQMLFVSNKDDEPVMLYRGVISGDSNIVIDAHSTALAALTFHPAFSTVGYDKYSDYEELVACITAQPHFAEYEGVVAQSIAQGRNLFDTTNTQFIFLYAKVVDEMCGEGDTSSGYKASKATSPLTELYGCWPIDITPDGDQLTFRMPGGSPSYWCDVHDKDGREVGKFTVPTRDNFGVWDMIKRAYITRQDFVYGDAVSWKFPVYEENYTFHFNRGGLGGRLDQYGQIISCILQGFGIPKVEDGLVTVLAEDLSQALSLLETGNGSWTSALETVVFTSFEVVLKEMCNKQSKIYRENAFEFAEKAQNCLKLLNLIEGSVNTIIRTVWNFASETEYYFCAQCNAPYYFTTCRPRLSAFSGNDQRGKMGETLSEQIVVEFKASDYSDISNYRVKFEPREDCGSVSYQWSDIDDNSFLANTDWTLGSSRMGMQKLFAMLYDKRAGKFIDTVIFNADAEGEHLMVYISCEGHETALYGFQVNVGGNIENNIVTIPSTSVHCMDYDGDPLLKVYSGTYNVSSHQLDLYVESYDEGNTHHYRTDAFTVTLIGNYASARGTLVYDDGAGCTEMIEIERMTGSKAHRKRQMTSDKDYHYDGVSCTNRRK